MTSIFNSDILTIILDLVGDWYQLYGYKFLTGKTGTKPVFADIDVITLMLAQDYIPFPSETQFIGFIRANNLDFFPNLLNQSQFNRHERALRLLVEQLRRYWIQQKGWHLQAQYLLDTKSVPGAGCKRDIRKDDFAGSANYSKCVNRNIKYLAYFAPLRFIIKSEGIVHGTTPN
jgi:hypothetical protein